MTREEAIKDIQENIKPFVGGKSLDMAIEALKADPIKHGRWETCKSGRYAVCTNCRMYWIPVEDKYDYWFCPRCGADMREVEE